jgi:hypothetical protein
LRPERNEKQKWRADIHSKRGPGPAKKPLGWRSRYFGEKSLCFEAAIATPFLPLTRTPKRKLMLAFAWVAFARKDKSKLDVDFRLDGAI